MRLGVAIALCGLAVSAFAGEIEPRDARYALKVETTRAAPGAARELVVRIEPKTGWHLSTEAPTSLVLEGSAGLRLAHPEQRGEQARARREDLIEFATGFETSGAAAASAVGRVKFGICREESCAIVRRDLDIPVEP